MVELNLEGHKLMYHPERVAEWAEKGDCPPIYVELGVSSACNHRCVFCALDFTGYQGNAIDTSVLLANLKDMAEFGVKSVMFAGEGEPLAHKDIGLFVEESKRLGMDVAITTNGALFTEDKIKQILPCLSWIRFSVDSGSSENYAKVHGTIHADFEKVMDNIKKCVDHKNKNSLNATIGVQFLVIPHNMGEAVKLAGRLSLIGVDNLQVKPYSHHPLSKNNLVVDMEEYNKIEENLKIYNSPNFKVLFRKATAKRIQEGINYSTCHGLPFFALTDAKGNVIPCNLFYDSDEHAYGNMNDNLFSDIWRSQGRKEVIQKLEAKGCADCRQGCRLDVINRYLARLKNPEAHDNYV